MSYLRLKNWRVRSRLLLLITIPTLAALVLGGARIAASVQSALAFQRAEQRAVLASAITSLAQQLETERDQSVYYIARGSSGRAGDLVTRPNSGAAQQYRVIQAFYRQTDQAITRFRALLAQVRGSYSAADQQKVAAALAMLNNLQYLRQASTRSLLYPLGVVQRYTGLIDGLLVIDDQAAEGAGDHVLSQTAAVLGSVSRMKEEASQQRAILSAALLQGSLTPQEASALERAQASQQSSQRAFDLLATGPQLQQWNDTVSGSFTDLAASEEQQAATLQAHAHSLAGDSLTAEGFYDSMSNGINNQMGSVERTLAADLITRSNSLRGSAVASAILIGLAVVILLMAAVTFTLVIGRSLTRPLLRLRADALEVADVRLPQTVRQIGEGGSASTPEPAPMEVDSTDEVGDVARAFDQVHKEAVRLASTEAGLRGTMNAMFVNLSRRSQLLVERQIGLIDDLEQGEREPERLANLFQMDHLATRMRRNSENLLVLAGHEVTRRWTQAATLIDVVRAAVSEIEQYERVTVDVQPDISVRGHAVSDVVHLLSELVENATSFSAGMMPVSVSGHLLGRDGALIAITDQGVGMSADEMAHANWRLENPPVVDVAVSRRMGLFVVAQLAARHGIRVRLQPAATGGLAALVWLPDEVISHETRVSLPRPPWRKAQAAEAGTAPPAPVTAGGLPDTRAGRPDDPAAEMQAATAGPAVHVRLPGPELGDTAAPTAAGPGTGAGPPAELPSAAGPVTAAGPGDGGAMGAGVAASTESPPVMTPDAESRLPIFESVESDWFRHGRQTYALDSWLSPADEGWRAAEVASAPVTGGTTEAGLPRRIPQANLVPGGVSGAPDPTPATPSRSPAQTRQRLASFQRGIQEGRAAARPADAPQ